MKSLKLSVYYGAISLVKLAGHLQTGLFRLTHSLTPQGGGRGEGGRERQSAISGHQRAATTNISISEVTL